MGARQQHERQQEQQLQECQLYLSVMRFEEKLHGVFVHVVRMHTSSSCQHKGPPAWAP